MKKFIYLLSAMLFIGAVVWGYFIYETTINIKSPALPADQASHNSNVASRIQVIKNQVIPTTMPTKSPKSPHVAESKQSVSTVPTEETQIPIEAILETGESTHHHVDFEAFLFAREERVKLIANQLDVVLTNEPPNPEWEQEVASQTEQALDQMINLKGVSVSDSVCVRSLCRLTISAETESVHEQVNSMSAAIGLMLGGDSWTKTDGAELISTVYLSKPGEKLPFTGD
ncbi:MAG: hypothetical protein V3U88_09685 [Methylococcales bacterium]